MKKVAAEALRDALKEERAKNGARGGPDFLVFGARREPAKVARRNLMEKECKLLFRPGSWRSASFHLAAAAHEGPIVDCSD